ncbi:MAG: hypothetical protein NVS4B3_06600 [Gemmatimonadaceae bacterium]
MNVVLNDIRSVTRREAHVTWTDDGSSESDAREGADAELPHSFAASPDLRLDLEAAIARLPPGARRAFVLHDIEGYKHDEISALTGTAPGTLRAQLFRARRLLIEALS